MALSFSQLTADKKTEGSIRNWVNDDLVPALTILSEAEQWIYERLRVREMLATATGSMVVGQDYVALPTGFIAPLLLQITGTEHAKLRLKTPREVEAAFSYDADGNRINQKPSIWYAGASNAQFDSPADQTYAYRLLHYASLTALSNSNESNVLTNRYARLLRCVCVGMAAEHQKDDEDRAYWLGLAEKQIAENNAIVELELAGEMRLEVG